MVCIFVGEFLRVYKSVCGLLYSSAVPEDTSRGCQISQKDRVMDGGELPDVGWGEGEMGGDKTWVL